MVKGQSHLFFLEEFDYRHVGHVEVIVVSQTWAVREGEQLLH
jgi:hypothetical protein